MLTKEQSAAVSHAKITPHVQHVRPSGQLVSPSAVPGFGCLRRMRKGRAVTPSRGVLCLLLLRTQRTLAYEEGAASEVTGIGSVGCYTGNGADQTGEQNRYGASAAAALAAATTREAAALARAAYELAMAPSAHTTYTGHGYEGEASLTVSGRVCQMWESNTPQKHNYTQEWASSYRGMDLADFMPENYCRNPDGRPGPWCYTTDPSKRWELCDIPVCGWTAASLVTAVQCRGSTGSCANSPNLAGVAVSDDGSKVVLAVEQGNNSLTEPGKFGYSSDGGISFSEATVINSPACDTLDAKCQ